MDTSNAAGKTSKVPLTTKVRSLITNVKETEHQLPSPVKWRLRKKPQASSFSKKAHHHQTLEAIEDDVVSGKDRLLAIMVAEKALALEAL